MSLFPDMPLPLTAPGSNGAAPSAAAAAAAVPDLSSGEIPGLTQSLLSLLRDYRPGDLGIKDLADRISVVLPVPEWAWYAWYDEVIGSTISAGLATDVVTYTVPTDERCWLDNFVMNRAAGDNLIDRMYLTYPAGYQNLANTDLIIRVASGTDVVAWPDPGGRQDADFITAGPLLLEPGTTMGYRTTGAGVSGTTFRHHLNMRRTKIIRTTTP